MKNLRIASVVVVALALCFCCAGILAPQMSAQSTYGSVSGSVADSSGGSLADVRVTLTSLDSGAKLPQTTGPDGLYLRRRGESWL